MIINVERGKKTFADVRDKMVTFLACWPKVARTSEGLIKTNRNVATISGLSERDSIYEFTDAADQFIEAQGLRNNEQGNEGSRKGHGAKFNKTRLAALRV